MNGAFLIAGLRFPEKYEPLIMGIEGSGAVIGADFVKAKLLQEIKTGSSGS